MIRVIVFYLFLCLAFGVSIYSFRHMTGLQAWKLIKLFGYSILCGTAALAVLLAIVILF